MKYKLIANDKFRAQFFSQLDNNLYVLLYEQTYGQLKNRLGKLMYGQLFDQLYMLDLCLDWQLKRKLNEV